MKTKILATLSTLILFVPFLSIGQVNPVRIQRAPGTGYLLFADTAGTYRHTQMLPLKVESGTPAYTPVGDSILYLDTLNKVFYGYISNTWEVLATPNLDNDPNNELQDLSWDDGTNTINITSGTGAAITGFVGLGDFIGVIEEDGQTPEDMNQADTVFFDLSYNSTGAESTWVESGQDLVYNGGNVSAGADFYVDGVGYEFRESSLDVIKFVPATIDVETLTWASSPISEGKHGYTIDFSTPATPHYTGDTLLADTSYWSYLETVDIDTLDPGWYKFWVDYDTVTFDLTQDVDAGIYLNAWLGPGEVEGDIKSIWFDAIYNELDPFSQPSLAWPDSYTPDLNSEYLYTDTLRTDSLLFYSRIPIDSTSNGTNAIVNVKDTTTYPPGYYRYFTGPQVDSAIAASQLSDTDLTELEELYINPVFFGFGSLDNLGAGVLNLGMYGPLAVAHYQMLAFGTEAYLTVRSTPSRPVNFRAVDENLNLGVEISTASEAGNVTVYDSTGAIAAEIRGNGNSIVNGTEFHGNRWGFESGNITTLDTIRASVLSIGPTTNTPSHTSNLLIDQDGKLSLPTLSPEQIDLPGDSTLLFIDGTTELAGIALESDSNVSLSIYTALGSRTGVLNSDKESRLKNGLVLSPDLTDTARASLTIKQDALDVALPYSFDVNEALVIENFSDPAKLSLLSDEGGTINYATDTDLDAAQFRYNASLNGFEWALGGNNKLQITNSGVDIYDGNITILNTGSHSDPIFRMYSDSGDSGDYFDIQDVDNQQVLIEKRSALSQALIDISPIPVDRSSNAQVRLFQNTNTTGKVSLAILNGDGSSDVNTELKGVTAGSGDSYINAFGGNLGIGTTTPSEKLTIENGNLVLQNTGTHANPLVRLYSETGVSGDYFDIQDVNDTGVRLDKHNDAGTTIIDISAIPGDGSSNGVVRFGRYTNSTGSNSVSILAGDGTSAPQSLLGMGGVDSYLNAIDGNVAIGHNSPTEQLHVIGNTILDGLVQFDVGRGLVNFENNGNDNADGAGVTLRTNNNPGSGSGSGSIFAVRSSGQAPRLWVGQALTSAGANDFAVGTPSTGSEANAGLYSIYMDASEGSVKADYFRFVPQGSAPTGSEGNVYYDSGDDELKVHDGTGYQSVGGGGGSQTVYSFIFMGDTQASDDEDYLPTNPEAMNPTTVGTSTMSFYNYDGTDLEFWAKNTNGFASYSGANFEIELIEDTDDNPTGGTVIHTFNIDDLDNRTNERFQESITLSADRFYWLKIESSGMSSSDEFVYGFTTTK